MDDLSLSEHTVKPLPMHFEAMPMDDFINQCAEPQNAQERISPFSPCFREERVPGAPGQGSCACGPQPSYGPGTAPGHGLHESQGLGTVSFPQ